MKKLFINILVLIVGFSNVSLAQQADYIFTNANIITAASKGARASAMAIKGGKIVFVGDVKKRLFLDSTMRIYTQIQRLISMS